MAGAFSLAVAMPARACTAFCAANERTVLVGNNEDDDNPFTVMWFVPAAKGSFGRMYVGYDNFDLQGGMNEKGLWFDAFATAPAEAEPGRPVYAGNLLDKAMAECATVRDVEHLFARHDLTFMKKAVLMFADANGDSIVIEPNAVIRRSGSFQVQTNFHQSLPVPEYKCERFAKATSMLGAARGRYTVDLFRRTLDATHAEGRYRTVYSNIYDLKRRVMYLYHFHDFGRPVRVDLARELKRGARAVTIRSLFPPSAAAAAYLDQRARELGRTEPPVVRVDPRLFDAYVGSWVLDSGVRFKVVREGSRLLLDADPLGRVEMYPQSETRFFLRITHAWVSFVRGPGRAVNEVLAFANGRESRGYRVR